MTTNPITNANVVSTTKPTTKGIDSLKSNDFLTLLIKELQSQDPLKPTDSNQLVQQMSQIRQMEMSSALNDTLGSFAQQQRIGGATNLIGRYVTGNTTSGSGSGSTAEVEGIVVGVQFDTTGNAILELHTGDLLPVKGLQTVALVDPNSLEPVAGSETPVNGSNTGSNTTTGGNGSTTPPAIAA